jgi:hypothetical protein
MDPSLAPSSPPLKCKKSAQKMTQVWHVLDPEIRHFFDPVLDPVWRGHFQKKCRRPGTNWLDLVTGDIVERNRADLRKRELVLEHFHFFWDSKNGSLSDPVLESNAGARVR